MIRLCRSRHVPGQGENNRVVGGARAYSRFESTHNRLMNGKEDTMREQRSSRRKRVFAMKVWVRDATHNTFEEYRSHDVSDGGTFVQTSRPKTPGTLLRFELKLAAEPQPIRGVARVVWTRDETISTQEHPAGMGLKFVKIDALSKSAIARLA